MIGSVGVTVVLAVRKLQKAASGNKFLPDVWCKISSSRNTWRNGQNAFARENIVLLAF